MATSILPTLTDGTKSYEFRAQFGGATYLVALRWNARAQAWRLSLSDSEGNVLRTKKVALGVGLLARESNSRLPYGELLALDTSGQDLQPGVDELGARVKLLFTDYADLFG